MPRPESDDETNGLPDIQKLIAQADAAEEFIPDLNIEPTEEELASNDEEPPVDVLNQLANIDIDDSIALYLKEVSKTPLLTVIEEVKLAQRIETGRIAREDIARGVPPRTRTRLGKVVEDGWQAREHLIAANGRLVISIAKKYIDRGLQFLDLIQEGNVGLMRAAKKFDYRRGHKFSTYATWWIRQSITRAVADQGRTIRIPQYKFTEINAFFRAQHMLTQRIGRDPTVNELAFELDIPPKKVESIIRDSRRPLSLEAPFDDDDDSVLGDFIEDKNADDPMNEATYRILREHIGEVLKGLPPREVRLLQLRYGLLDGQARTLEEVGEKMGVTRERIRQIEAQALSRLRHPSVKRKLRDYIGK